MNRLALVTIAIGERHEKIAQKTAITQMEYAHRIGADFIIYNQNGYKITRPDGGNFYLNSNYWAIKKIQEETDLSVTEAFSVTNATHKFNIVELLSFYDRIIFLDIDIIVRGDAPSLFDIVPEDSLGMFPENKYFEDRDRLITEYAKNAEETDYRIGGQYYNSGVLVFSKANKKVFEPPIRKYEDLFLEQTAMSWNIIKNNIKIFPLSYKFNTMHFLEKTILEQRYDSYFIHYGGSWMQLEEGSTKDPLFLLNLISYDLDVWKKNAPRHNYLKLKNTRNRAFWEMDYQESRYQKT